jgi:hypothetical protein
MSGLAVNGNLEFMAPIAEGLVLACGWIISDQAGPPDLFWKGVGKATPVAIQCRWTERSDLPGFLECGAVARGKFGFIAAFPVPRELAGQVTLEAHFDTSAAPALKLRAPSESFAGYFEDAPRARQFAIVELLGSLAPVMTADQRLAYAAAMQPWLDTMPVCESSASVGGVSFGFDRVAISDNGQLFCEGWMKVTGPSCSPSLRMVMTTAGGFACLPIEQSVLRPDIAPPGAGGLRRPGFFLVAQSRQHQDDGPANVVIEVTTGGALNYLRLLPRPTKADVWHTSFSNRIADEARVSQDARHALLRFFGTPALGAGSAETRTGPARLPLAAICVVDVYRDDPCRGLIQTSLSRLPRRDLKIILIADEETARKGPDIGPAWTDRDGTTVFGDTLAAGLLAAKLDPADSVLFLSSATLIRRGMLEALETAMSGVGTSHCLFSAPNLSREHLDALERVLAREDAAPGSDARARRSTAYLDFFAPMIAPVGAILDLAEGWTPAVPGMLYREAIRRAARRGEAMVVPLPAITSYRQHRPAGNGLVALYKEIL